MDPETDIRDDTPESRPRLHRFNRAAALWACLGFTTAVAVIASFQAWGSLAESQTACPPGGSLISFVARTPARAADINCNFSNLDGRLDAIETSVLFVTTPSCPAGYTPYVAGQGRYLVGAPAGAPTGESVGTALGDRENRPVGQHTHAATQAMHDHDWNDPGHTHGIRSSNNDSEGPNNDYGTTSVRTNQTQPAFTGITFNAEAPAITVEDAGSVPGTPAPYVQLRVCVRAP